MVHLFVYFYITKRCLIITFTTPLYIMTLTDMHCHKFTSGKILVFRSNVNEVFVLGCHSALLVV
jgi:hypothetical protein